MLHVRHPCSTNTGLQAASYQPGSGEAAVQEAKLKVVFSEATEEETREVLGGCDAPELNLGILLEPSTAPAALVLLVGGKEVPIQVPHSGLHFRASWCCVVSLHQV